MTFGRIDILVNNAGGATDGFGNTLENISDEQWRIGIDTNLTGAVYCSRAVIPHMLEEGGGQDHQRDVRLRAARRPQQLHVHERQGRAHQLHARAGDDLRAGHPGEPDRARPLPARRSRQAIEWWRGGKFTPMGRLGKDEELGPLCVFLASDLTSYMNGQIIVLDGGGLAGGHAPTGFAPRRAAAARRWRDGRASSRCDGKSALVIGASNPIGRAIAVALGEAGADVAVATTTRAQARRGARQLLLQRDVGAQPQDIRAGDRRRGRGGRRALIARAVSEFGRLDVLVNAQDLPFAKPAYRDDHSTSGGVCWT